MTIKRGVAIVSIALGSAVVSAQQNAPPTRLDLRIGVSTSLGTSFTFIATNPDGSLPPIEAAKVPPQVQLSFRRLAGSVPIANGQIRLFRLDPDNLQKTLRPPDAADKRLFVELPLFDGSSLNIERRGIETRARPEAYGWTGTVIAPPGAKQPAAAGAPVVLTVSDSQLYGAIGLPTGPVRIRPVGGAFHVLYAVDVSRLPPDHGPKKAYAKQKRSTVKAGSLKSFRSYVVQVKQGKKKPKKKKPAAADAPSAPTSVCSATGSSDGTQPVCIAVAVAYTQPAAAALGAADPDPVLAPGDTIYTHHAQNLFDQTNDYFKASGIKVHLALAGALPVTIQETLKAGQTYGDLADHLLADAMPSELRCFWNSTGASSLALIGELGGATNPDNFCGTTEDVSAKITTSFPLSKLFKDPSGRPGYFGYSVINRVCAENEYSFSHEFGHQIGFHHERAALDPLYKGVQIKVGGVYKDFGYGFVLLETSVRGFTIMALGNGGPDRVNRKPIFSTTDTGAKSPVPGVTQWGDTDSADNAALAALVASEFAKRQPPSCPKNAPLPGH